MKKSYKVVGSNGIFDHLLNQILVGEQEKLADLTDGREFHSFLVGDIDYDLEIQEILEENGETFLFCWLTDEQNCGRVCLQPVDHEENSNSTQAESSPASGQTI